MLREYSGCLSLFTCFRAFFVNKIFGVIGVEGGVKYCDCLELAVDEVLEEIELQLLVEELVLHDWVA